MDVDEKEFLRVNSQSLRYQVTPSDYNPATSFRLPAAHSQSLRYQVTPSDARDAIGEGFFVSCSQSLRYQVTPSDGHILAVTRLIRR